MQAPSRPDKETRGGFTHGGWAQADNDHVMSEALGERMQGGPLLLGRRSYEDMLRYWYSLEGSLFAAAPNAAPKYVASTNASTTHEWPNSTLLHGDIPAAVGDLKDKPGGDIAIMGSGELIQSLMPHNLIDEYLTSI
jgi:dihydrofolate reductase